MISGLQRGAAATKHALTVSRLWRLCPRVIEAALVRRARVEAELRLAAEGNFRA